MEIAKLKFKLALEPSINWKNFKALAYGLNFTLQEDHVGFHLMFHKHVLIIGFNIWHLEVEKDGLK